MTNSRPAEIDPVDEGAMTVTPCSRAPLVLLPIALSLCVGLSGCHSGAQRDGAAAEGCSPCDAGLPGDLNDSGTPDITDAVGILRIIVGLDPANPLADCDCDDATGITDAIALLRCLVGLAPWPIVCGPALGDTMVGPDGQTLLWAPGDSFMMGSEDVWADSQPVHQVTLDGFWIGRCEVTNDQYAAFLNAAQPADIYEYLAFAGEECGVELVGDTYQAKTGMGGYPIVYVRWTGAAAYCEHYGYSLPTEAQWEYAAAGPDANRYPWGADWDVAKCCNGENKGPLYDTQLVGFFEVGSFPQGASWCGALDMAGNVFEWCADWFDMFYYETSPEHNPTGPAEPPFEEVYDRVLRGGSWISDDWYCRCALRMSWGQDGFGDQYGFRVVMGETVN